jgi:hypothetical protein
MGPTGILDKGKFQNLCRLGGGGRGDVSARPTEMLAFHPISKRPAIAFEFAI